MKSRTFTLLSGSLTLGFGYWLAEQSRDSREIWISLGAWILGFWFASSLLAEPRPSEASRVRDEADEVDDDEDWDDDEDAR